MNERAASTRRGVNSGHPKDTHKRQLRSLETRGMVLDRLLVMSVLRAQWQVISSQLAAYVLLVAWREISAGQQSYSH
jgi:hypothetical protein